MKQLLLMIATNIIVAESNEAVLNIMSVLQDQYSLFFSNLGLKESRAKQQHIIWSKKKEEGESKGLCSDEGLGGLPGKSQCFQVSQDHRPIAGGPGLRAGDRPLSCAQELRLPICHIGQL